MSNQGRVIIHPIGFVKTDATGEETRDKTKISQIIINNEFADGLVGVTGFSHLFVLFWLNRVPSKKRKTLKVHPRGRRDMPLLGVFATRTMLRPNPIGLTLVKLIKVEDNVLTVRGLDAFNETPVLDVKPFDPWDTAENVQVPHWWLRLENEKKRL